MSTTAEQQELRQIEQQLRGSDRGFVWRLTLLQSVLRWAAPGRQVYLLVLAVPAAALLWPIAAAWRLLAEFARAAMLTEQTTVMILGDTAWLGWESGQAPGHCAGRAKDRPQPGSRDRHHPPSPT